MIVGGERRAKCLNFFIQCHVSRSYKWLLMRFSFSAEGERLFEKLLRQCRRQTCAVRRHHTNPNHMEIVTFKSFASQAIIVILMGKICHKDFRAFRERFKPSSIINHQILLRFYIVVVFFGLVLFVYSGVGFSIWLKVLLYHVFPCETVLLLND